MILVQRGAQCVGETESALAGELRRYGFAVVRGVLDAHDIACAANSDRLQAAYAGPNLPARVTLWGRLRYRRG